MQLLIDLTIMRHGAALGTGKGGRDSRGILKKYQIGMHLASQPGVAEVRVYDFSMDRGPQRLSCPD